MCCLLTSLRTVQAEATDRRILSTPHLHIPCLIRISKLLLFKNQCKQLFALSLLHSVRHPLHMPNLLATLSLTNARPLLQQPVQRVLLRSSPLSTRHVVGHYVGQLLLALHYHDRVSGTLPILPVLRVLTRSSIAGFFHVRRL